MEQCPFEQQQIGLAQVHELYKRKTQRKEKEKSTIKNIHSNK